VALEAELVSFRGKQFPVLSAMGIMAGGAPVQQRGMQSLFLHDILHFGVTGEAQCIDVFDQERRVIRLVGDMTGRAISLGCRRMQIGEFHLVGMTGKTELLDRLCQEFGFIRGMRLMTGSAHAALHG